MKHHLNNQNQFLDSHQFNLQTIQQYLHLYPSTKRKYTDYHPEEIDDYTGKRMVKKNYDNGQLANTVTSWSDAYETKAINGGGTENTSYYFVNNELVAKKDNGGNKTYFHNDHLGSSSIVTNQSGGLVEATSYDPWGKIRSGGTASKFLYTGQEHDGETGLDYYNARYYNSDIRRFTQPDDIIQDWYDPQTLNRYSYVKNNPIKYTDPTGHQAVQAAQMAEFEVWGQ